MKEKSSIKYLNFELTYPISEQIIEVSLNPNVKTLCLTASTAFGLADEQQLIFDYTIRVYRGKMAVRFKPLLLGSYFGLIKGYNANQQEVVRYYCRGKYQKKMPFARLMIALVGLFLLLSSLVFYNMNKKSKVGIKPLFVEPIDLVFSPNDTLYIGSTEAYNDALMLNARMHWANIAALDCDKYAHKSLKELYQLLNEEKINAIISNRSDIDTISLIWSDSYTCDGLRLGLSKTQKNTTIIQKFNHL